MNECYNGHINELVYGKRAQYQPEKQPCIVCLFTEDVPTEASMFSIWYPFSSRWGVRCK
jgi:hypothetical protein